MHTQLGILHPSALAGLSDLRSGSACRAAATPVCSYIHELYATHHLPRLHGLAGTWMDACTVQYVACSGACNQVLVGRDKEPGSPSHLVLKGYAAVQKPFLPGVSSENGILLVRSSIGWNTIVVVGLSVLGANSTSTTTTFVGRESRDYAVQAR